MMTRFTVLAAALSIQSVSAFAPGASCNKHATALNLVPEESQRLVAFSQDYLSKKSKESASKASNLTSSPRRRSGSKDGSSPRGVASVARSLVTRLVGIEEKSARKDTSLKATVDEELNLAHKHSEDEVMYPIVGFNLVDGHAVPTPGQEAACKLHLNKKEQHEEVLGYWSGPQEGDSLWM